MVRGTIIWKLTTLTKMQRSTFLSTLNLVYKITQVITSPPTSTDTISFSDLSTASQTETNDKHKRFGHFCIGKEKTVLVVLRVLAICATLSATIVMALNKETKTIAVATIGNTPIKATITERFQDTPANIFFIVANALATLHNLLMVILEVFGEKFDRKGVRFTATPILDTVLLALVSAGASSVASMSDLAKHGNSHAQWNKICDKFDRFCSHGGGALLASFIGAALMLAICVLLNLKASKNKCDTISSEAWCQK